MKNIKIYQTMKEKEIKILHLEDDSADAKLVCAILESDGIHFTMTCVQTSGEFSTALRNGHYDLILADYKLPSYDGLSALRFVRERDLDIPFIFVSGALGEDAAIQALTEGATDYVLKQKLKRLPSAVVRALHDAENRKKRRNAEEALRKSEEDLREAQRLSLIGSWSWDLETDIITWSEEYYHIYEMNPQLRPPRFEQHLRAFTSESAERFDAAVKLCIQTGKSYQIDLEQIHTDGAIHWITARGEVKLDEKGQIVGLRGTTQDINDRKLAEKKIENQIQRLTALRAIDNAISSSFDLRLILDVLLEEVTTQLHVDAAVVFLFNNYLNEMEYAAGRGFLGNEITHLHLKLGESYAGTAAFERSVICLPNLNRVDHHFNRADLIEDEGFVAFYAVPLIAKGQVKGVLEVFHRTPLDPDADWLDYLETMAGQSAIAIDNVELFQRLERSNTELMMAYDTTIEGWSRALDLRDKETDGHTFRVTEMTLQLAREMGISDPELVQIRRGAMLHDIGKMGVPDAILFKSEALTEEEFKNIHKYPEYAFKLLSPIAFLHPALDIPYCHHENWDGTGYPRGLKGKQIPLPARIFMVVDVWDALTSDRPQRTAWTKEKALEYIQSKSGSHFDPEVVKMFIESKAYQS